MDTTTDKYVISLSGCRITCHHRQEPQVTITTIGPQGVIVEQKPFREVFWADVLPFFTATYLPRDKEFDVDLDCGAQRWRGSQSVVAVRRALAKCGVLGEMSKQIVAKAVKAARSG